MLSNRVLLFTQSKMQWGNLRPFSRKSAVLGFDLYCAVFSCHPLSANKSQPHGRDRRQFIHLVQISFLFHVNVSVSFYCSGSAAIILMDFHA